jgi:trimeric autotransporter adhesin
VNTFNAQTGANSSTACVACASGMYSVSGSSGCSFPITTIAGTGTAGSIGDGFAATSAQLNYPYGLTSDASGNVFVADYSNNRVRKISAATGLISTVLGTGAAGSSSNALYNPTDLIFDASGNLIICDAYNQRIQKLSSPSLTAVTTIAGNGVAVSSGDSGAATSASLNYPFALALDAQSNLYIGEWSGNRVRKVSSTGIITTFVGTGSSGTTGDGQAATLATITAVSKLAIDAVGGNLLIALPGSNRIRMVNMASGIITTLIGGNPVFPKVVGGGAFLNWPFGVSVDKSSRIYICDNGNNRIITLTNSSKPVVRVLIGGTTVAGSTGDGGPSSLARLNGPINVNFDISGNLYIADYLNNKIRAVRGMLKFKECYNNRLMLIIPLLIITSISY